MEVMEYTAVIMKHFRNNEYTNLIAFTTFPVEKFFGFLRNSSNNDNSAIRGESVIVKAMVMNELRNRIGIDTEIRTRLSEYQTDIDHRVIIDANFEGEM